MDDKDSITLDANLDTLEEWAQRVATSVTGSLSETAQMAEIVLGLIATDRIGHSA